MQSELNEIIGHLEDASAKARIFNCSFCLVNVYGDIKVAPEAVALDADSQILETVRL